MMRDAKEAKAQEKRDAAYAALSAKSEKKHKDKKRQAKARQIKALRNTGISRTDDLYFSESRFFRKVQVWDERAKCLNFGAGISGWEPPPPHHNLLHAPEPSYHTRTCPSIDGECCVKCALVTKQYCLHRKTVLLLPPKDAEKTMLCH